MAPGTYQEEVVHWVDETGDHHWGWGYNWAGDPLWLILEYASGGHLSAAAEVCHWVCPDRNMALFNATWEWRWSGGTAH